MRCDRACDAILWWRRDPILATHDFSLVILSDGMEAVAAYLTLFIFALFLRMYILSLFFPLFYSRRLVVGVLHVRSRSAATPRIMGGTYVWRCVGAVSYSTRYLVG